MSALPSRPPELPAPADFAARLASGLPGWRDVSWVAATGSTNADLQARLREAAGPAAPTLAGAHLQHAGRGRAGRAWQARAGDALLFSCGLPVDLPPALLPPLSIVAGVAACEALARLAPQAAARLRLKWPNDLQLDGAKFAGILAETVSLPAAARPARIGLVLGIGINLHGAAALSAQLGRAVSDWSSIGTPDPVAMVAAVALGWERAVADYARDGFAPFRARFDSIDALAGLAVRVVEGGTTLMHGTARGLDESGRLRLDTADGPRAVTVGDVSVRAEDGTP